jgi:DNA processing protein
MDNDTDLVAWLKFCLIPGLGGEGQRHLLKLYGSPASVLDQPLSELSRHLRPSAIQGFRQEVDVSLIEATLAWLDDPANHVITLGDQHYPQTLLSITDPPVLLYVKGRLDLLNQRSLAVVGSRNATAQGLRNAESFALALSDAGLCIVSGMAAGIDRAAHVGGLQGSASSIAVIGTGLDKVYPASNRELAHRLAEQGVIVSEFPLGTPPLAANFPRRNRIISGLGLGCLVVEASIQSGSLISARLALEQGRDVFAIPGSIHSPQSRGCHLLIKQGAKLVESAQDILEELGSFAVLETRIPSPTVAHPLLEHVGFDPIDADTLAQRCGLTISEVSAILLKLELDGHIATLPGGFYQRIA